MLRRLLARRFVRRSALSVIDQGVLSGVNFASSLVAARVLDQAGFGAYGFGFSLVFMMQTVQHSVLGESQEVLVSSMRGEEERQMVGTLAVLQVALTATLAAGLALLGTVWPGPTGRVLPLAGLVVLALLPHDFVRRLLLARLHVQRTLAMSITRMSVHFSILLGLWAAGWLELPTLYAASAVGAAVAALLGGRTALRGVRGTLVVRRELVADLIAFSRWIVLKNLSRYVLFNLNYWAVLLLLGLRAGGRYSAGYLVVSVVNVMAIGLSGFFTPYFSRLFREQPHLYARRVALAGAAWAGLFVPLGGAVALFAGPLLKLFYGGRYGDITLEVRLFALDTTLTVLVIFFDIVFKSVRRPQDLWRLQLWAMLPPLAALWPLVHHLGVPGALICAGLQLLVLNVLMGYRAARLLGREVRDGAAG